MSFGYGFKVGQLKRGACELDGNKSGIVVTSLYARTGNRWYVKEIESGKGVKIELSHEEELAITRAAGGGN